MSYDQVKEAYEVLRDDGLRKLYDSTGFKCEEDLRAATPPMQQGILIGVKSPKRLTMFMIAAEHSVPEWGMRGEYRQLHRLWDHRRHFDARAHGFGPWHGGLY